MATVGDEGHHDVPDRIDVLMVSNGHGEDAIAGHIGAALVGRYPDMVVGGFALVGDGRGYDRAGVPVFFRSQPMPSGGFGWQAPRWFWQDLRAGFARLTARQLDGLRRLRPRVRALLCVGDIYPALLTAAYRGIPRVYLGTARSDYIGPHFGVEKAFLARGFDVVFTRDEPTARTLRAAGVPAECPGNVMMDMLQPAGVSLGVDVNAPVLALLPGSRHDVADNLAAMMSAVERVWSEVPELQVVAALAPATLAMVARRPPAGWRWEPAELADETGLDGRLCCEACTGNRQIGVSVRGFADVLARAEVVLGLSGTANEQAAGMGRPVVAFPRPGVQYTRHFARRQKRLLGDGLILTEGPEAAATTISRLLADPELRARHGAAGQERMGPPGATQVIVARIAALMGRCPGCPEPVAGAQGGG